MQLIAASRHIIRFTSLLLAAWLCSKIYAGRSYTKGGPISIPSVIACILLSSLVATLVSLFWRRFPAPFVAGIAGVFCVNNALSGPVGGVLGFLIGLATVMTLPQQTPELGTVQLKEEKVEFRA